MFHDRQGDAEDVGFLEGIGSNRRPRNLTGDHHHRHRIHLSGGNARDQVGRPRTGRSEAHTDSAGRTRIGISRMGSALFMTHEEVTQPTLALCHMQGVVDRKNGAARVAENRIHTVQAQRIHQGLGSAHPATAITAGRCVGRGSGDQRHCVVTGN